MFRNPMTERWVRGPFFILLKATALNKLLRFLAVLPGVNTPMFRYSRVLFSPSALQKSRLIACKKSVPSRMIV